MSLYFDNNATSILANEAQKALQSLSLEPLNPSSRHRYGQKARSMLEAARCKVAQNLQAKPKELLWTSGATEGINLAIRTLARVKSKSKEGVHEVLLCPCEHSATLETANYLKDKGWKTRFLKGADQGRYTIETISEQIRPETQMLVLMAANNETGVLQPIDQLSEFIQKTHPHIDLVVDAVAAYTKTPLVFYPGVKAMIFSGHKFHALQGAGFVLMRGLDEIPPFLFGGGQEHGVRCGTVNLPGVLSLEAAVELFEKDPKSAEMQLLRDLFEEKIQTSIPGVFLNTRKEERVSNTSNLYFEGIDGEALLVALERRGLYASMGSACSSGMHQSSHVLRAMGYSLERIQGSIRFSLSRYTTKQEVEQATAILSEEVKNQRNTFFAL